MAGLKKKRDFLSSFRSIFVARSSLKADHLCPHVCFVPGADVATSPNTQWNAQTGTGGTYTSKGKPANWVSYEVRDGVRVRGVYQPATGKVVTAFPDNAPVPSSYKKTQGN